MSTDLRLPRVVHLRREPHDVRIDRQTHWGNPFAIGKDGTRDQVCAKHEQWFMDDPVAIKLAKRDLRGKVLGCWCAPKRCHGDTLLIVANCDCAGLIHDEGCPMRGRSHTYGLLLKNAELWRATA